MSQSQTPSDLVTTKSSYPFPATLERLETAAKNAGLVVFAHLDHAGAAKAAGLEMPPATVLVVGNPRAGTPQFLQHPTLAIDLPLKMLVWENQAAKYSSATTRRPSRAVCLSATASVSAPH